MPSQRERQFADLKSGDEIEMYVIASNEGWEWTPATVLETEPLRIRWWDGEEKAWTREGARIPRIRARAVKEPAHAKPYRYEAKVSFVLSADAQDEAYRMQQEIVEIVKRYTTELVTDVRGSMLDLKHRPDLDGSLRA